MDVNIEANLNQLTASWDMIATAIEIIPDEVFIETENDWSPNDCLFHIIETNRFYLSNSPSDMNWGEKAGIDRNSQSEDEVKSKTKKISKLLLKEYLTEIRDEYRPKLRLMEDEQFLSKTDFVWFQSYHEQLLYLIRHNMYHLGEISYYLRNKGFTRLQWK